MPPAIRTQYYFDWHLKNKFNNGIYKFIAKKRLILYFYLNQNKYG